MGTQASVPRISVYFEIELRPRPRVRLMSAGCITSPPTTGKPKSLRAAIRRVGMAGCIASLLDLVDQGRGPQNDIRWALGLPLLTKADEDRATDEFLKEAGHGR